MRGQGELLLRPWQGRSRKCFFSDHNDTITFFIGEGRPSYFFIITHTLWSRPIDELICNSTVVQFYILCSFTVGIVIYRTTAIVYIFIVFRRKLQRIADPRENKTFVI